MSESQISINRIDTSTVEIPIVGCTPLIVHRFTEKSRRQMLDAMQGRRTPRQNKDPEADYESSLYRLDDDGYGFPSIAFKAATVSAARFFDRSVTMTSLRQSLFVSGEYSKREGQMLVRIDGQPTMREDVVRVGNGGTDLRYRGEFADWRTTLTVVFVRSALTPDSVLSLVEAGGVGVGVGEWRPERRGDFGTFQVDASREVQVVG